MNILISPSILAGDFSRLGAEAEKAEFAKADWLHIDVMDGHFVPNITIGAPVVKSLRSRTKLTFDVHLMISEPLKYVEDFAAAGADIITFHVECDSSIDETIEKIKGLGCRVGLSVKPGTSANAVMPYLDKIDMVLVMTVEPGFGGQAFMPETMPKLKALRDEIRARKLNVDLQVDGGISDKTIAAAAQNGANIFVAGSAVFGADNPALAVANLREAASQAFC